MRGWLFLTLVLIGSLFSLTGMRQFFVEPLANSSTNFVWFVIQVLPLLAVIPGVMRMWANTYFFTVVAAMLYFVHGVLVCTTPHLMWFGIAEIVLSLLLTAVATYVLRQLRQQS